VGASGEGEYGMLVKIDKGDGFFVRSAGISVPLPDAEVKDDPNDGAE
jgi:hypothetical protein